MMTKYLIAVLLLLSTAFQLQAATVVGIVSPRNTAEVLGGAQQFLANYPQHQIQLRTTEQFSQMSEPQRRQLLGSADLIFAGGVFGDTVFWLNQYIKDNQGGTAFLSVHSERSLVQASRLNGRWLLNGVELDELMADPPLDTNLDQQQWFKQQLVTHKLYRSWFVAKSFWAGRDSSNMAGLFAHLFALTGQTIEVPEPQLQSPLRIFFNGQPIARDASSLPKNTDWVAVLDYESGDRSGERDLHDKLCASIQANGWGCVQLLAKWGESSVLATDWLSQHRGQIAAVVSLQNFVIGGGEGREAVNQALVQLNVPVINAIRLSDSSEQQWQLSEQGLRADSVHYRVAMPELQGIIEPMVLAAMAPVSIDPQTGVALALSQPIDSQLVLLGKRLKRWLALRNKANRDKKIAVVYYNHPPGRHNIGADNLNVPASLWHLLQQLKAAGYSTGPLPETEQQLLDLLQARGVNLPEDRQALANMADTVTSVDTEQYRQWFEQLPEALQQEMVNGPLAYLHVQLQRAIELEDKRIGRQLMHRVIEDLHHAIEGADHPAKARVIRLLDQLEHVYEEAFNGRADWAAAQQLVKAIADSGIEGIRGWGQIPGNIMVHEQQLLIPGIRFGNVFIGPQPPRGWELNEELLHANLSFPPPHQYLAFYQWLRHGFKADAVVHVGRHSTYEFLPRRRVGMSEEDYSLAALGDLPSIYPYIVDGVGEGIQAKRRGLAVMIDHLTPPLDSTDLYDRLLELRQLVESYEAAPANAGAMRARAITAIKGLVDELKLRDELVASMSGELAVRGITEFDQVDDELLVHEVGHYLTKLQEDFMPLGLHVFGRDWGAEAIDTMLNSMAQGDAIKPQWQQQLAQSPAAEMSALLTALSGGYIAPGKGNDPIRTPEALPTGRNFYALDGSLIPSRLGYQVGVELARKARQGTQSELAESDAVVLWASDVVRDEGAMIAFGLDMLGIKPLWSSRGIVKGLQRLSMADMRQKESDRVRRDTLFTTSGLFRDLYGAHLIWLDRAVLMALDASAGTIREDYPALALALNAALAPLGAEQNPGREPLTVNHVASRWVQDARQALQQGHTPEQAGREATYRVFGDAPGSYGAGVNRMVERSGSWKKRSEIADVYIHRMGHAYGQNLQGEPVQDNFKKRLNVVSNTYLGRASNLYGLLDNNDSFDYLGGLSLAVETVKGEVPDSFVMFHPDAVNLSVEPLQVALLSELRGRFLNPQWLKPLMDEGYAGARTMGSEFLEYLWGWQVTNPELIKKWVWDEVKAVYIDDKLAIGLNEFLQQGHNVHVKSNMIAVMLVAAQKQFWQADPQSLQQLAEQFADLLLENGLPGSGHTSPDHPLFDWLEDYVSAEKYSQLQQLLAAARVDVRVDQSPSVVAEVNMSASQPDTPQSEHSPEQAKPEASSTEWPYPWLALLALLLLLAGIYRGSRLPVKTKE